MAGRQRTTFQKRQKEVKRLEKQKMKADKRATRRLERSQNRPLEAPGIPEIPPPPVEPELNQL